MDPGFDDFVGTDAAPLYAASTGRRAAGHLLWGDGVRLLDGRERAAGEG